MTDNLGKAILETTQAALTKQREERLKQARQDVRHGPDLARSVKPWHRMQAGWSLTGGTADELLAKGAEKVTSWPGFVRESFSRLYSGDSVPERKPEKEHSWASRMHGLLDDLPEWKRLTERCRGDAYSAKAATVSVAARLVEHVPEHKKDAREARRRRDLLQEEHDEAVQQAEEEGCPAPAPSTELRQAEGDLIAAQAEAERLAAGIDESAARQGMRAAVTQVNEELDDLDRALSSCGWGTEEAGQSAESKAEMKARIAEKLRDQRKLRKIMELAGRMKNIMREVQAVKVRHGVSELSDIETGADLARLLPSELMQLRHPQMRLLLARKIMERDALQYRLEAKEKLGRGPLVVCIDDSGSMAGGREVWAKAVALALLELARRQKRSFAYCTFSTSITSEYVEEAGRRKPPVDLLTALAAFRGGGTDFDEPMSWALTRIEAETGLKEADVVFISDGDCQARDVASIVRRLKASDARCWGVAVGPSAVHDRSPGAMPSWCDRVYPIEDVVPGGRNAEEHSSARGVFGAI